MSDQNQVATNVPGDQRPQGNKRTYLQLEPGGWCYAALSAGNDSVLYMVIYPPSDTTTFDHPHFLILSTDQSKPINDAFKGTQVTTSERTSYASRSHAARQHNLGYGNPPDTSHSNLFSSSTVFCNSYLL